MLCRQTRTPQHGLSHSMVPVTCHGPSPAWGHALSGSTGPLRLSLRAQHCRGHALGWARSCLQGTGLAQPNSVQGTWRQDLAQPDVWTL